MSCGTISDIVISIETSGDRVTNCESIQDKTDSFRPSTKYVEIYFALSSEEKKVQSILSHTFKYVTMPVHLIVQL